VCSGLTSILKEILLRILSFLLSESGLGPVCIVGVLLDYDGSNGANSEPPNCVAALPSPPDDRLSKAVRCPSNPAEYLTGGLGWCYPS